MLDIIGALAPQTHPEGEMMYASLQVAPDGDYITEYSERTPDDIWERVNDQGSRWFFYPVPFVIVDPERGRGHYNGAALMRQRIISAPNGFEHLKGLTVKTALAEVADMFEREEVPW